MEEISNTKSHKLILTNRKNANFTGILDVLSFDVAEVLLETELGMLHIKGKDLHVNRLNLEKGEADIEGEVDTMTYSKIPDVSAKKDKMFGKEKEREDYWNFSKDLYTHNIFSDKTIESIQDDYIGNKENDKDKAKGKDDYEISM